VQNQCAQHLLDGKSSPIAFDTFVNQFQLVSGYKNNINLTRAVSRLKSVFVTHYQDLSAVDDYTANKLEPHLYKVFNTFYHPSYANNTGLRVTTNDFDTDMELQLQIGSVLYPEYPIKSASEAFYQLRKCLGLHNTGYHSIDIKPQNYAWLKYIVGIDLERTLGAGYTGINTRAGDLLSVKTTVNNGSATALTSAHLPSRMYVTMHCDMIMHIRDTGVEVME